MQSWLNFWVCIFWLTLVGFLFNPTNFIFLLIYSEITWISLFCYSILTGSVTDDLNNFTLSFFILGLASIEFCVGFLLIILFRNLNKIINFTENETNWYTYFYKNSRKLTSKKNNWNLN